MSKGWFPVALRLVVASLIVNFTLFAPIQADDHVKKAYIVYMGERPTDKIPVADIYLNMIMNVLEGDLVDATEYLLHTYKNFHGCVAHLTDKQAELMSKMDGVVSVFPSRKNRLRTTRSWDFMGFPLDVKRSSVESDVIVGVIDSGIWPESESFNDEGFGPPPAKWKGTCDTSLNFSCNNKIIGAQYFRADKNISAFDVASPRDSIGHGTHTASTAAGVAVDGASFLGLGQGIARGGVPSARIAVYKACWSEGCDDADVLVAFDTAISDGVDIISASIGFALARPFFEDTMAIGAFHAMKKCILTSASAGNAGPSLQTVENSAPWFLTVAASSTDRKFITQVKLGNGMIVEGISLNTFDPENKTFPLIYAGDAPNVTSDYVARYCQGDSLDDTLVKGKIVICDAYVSGYTPLVAGAAGIIMQGLDYHDAPGANPLPAIYLNMDDATRVLSYTRNLRSTPYGTILKTVAIYDATIPPTVGSFSSRGPSLDSPGILKPDLTAPGVSILAAWSPLALAGEDDFRSVPYNIMSGTSMACPHVTGVAAYVKSFHPSWSPAAIKSALMTTALEMSSNSNVEAELAYGAGHINPLKAVNPGLVYDAGEDDYIKYLCSQGLTATEIRLISGKRNSCSKKSEYWELNYPSMALPTSAGAFDTIFYRTVTNVGSPNSTYHVSVTTPEGQAMAIKVQPNVLSFHSLGQKLSFTVRVTGSIGLRALISASLVWDDGEHQVRSPIVVYNLS